MDVTESVLLATSPVTPVSKLGGTGTNETQAPLYRTPNLTVE